MLLQLSEFSSVNSQYQPQVQYQNKGFAIELPVYSAI